MHGVSLPLTNKLVSGDNKGLAAYLFERRMGTTYLQPREFVAGFEQSNSGDISPYDPDAATEGGTDGFQRNSESAALQFGKAWELYSDKQATVLRGPVAAAHRFEDLAYKAVAAPYAAPGTRICNGVLGVSFAAGTKNGRPFPIFPEHAVYGKTWLPITLLPQEQACHAEKVLLLPTGFVEPEPWTARVAPFQIIRIGELAVVATPFEITTMAGRRLKEQVLRSLAPSGVRFVALSALANEYLHYVTTREEYAVQSYEGGATLFGPDSLAAYSDIFHELTVDLATGRAREPGPLPRDLTNEQVVLPHDVLFDAPPEGSAFGDVKEQPRPYYHRGELVQAAFWGAHPNNSLAPNRSYLTVEQWSGNAWEIRLRDWDPQTRMHWERSGLAASLLRTDWQIDSDQAPGLYRICQTGAAKMPFTGDLKPYTGCSQTFQVGP